MGVVVGGVPEKHYCGLSFINILLEWNMARYFTSTSVCKYFHKLHDSC